MGLNDATFIVDNLWKSFFLPIEILQSVLNQC